MYFAPFRPHAGFIYYRIQPAQALVNAVLDGGALKIVHLDKQEKKYEI